MNVPAKAGRTGIAVALGLLCVLGLGLRVVHLAGLSESPYFTRPMIDGQAYDQLALAIRDGAAPARPFYQDPLYPHVLALLYLIFGHRYLAVYVFQLVLGLAAIALVFDTTRRLFEFRAAVAAGLLTAVYPVFIFYEGVIEKTALAVFLVALAAWATACSLAEKRDRWPPLAGVALGLAALVRANLLVLAPLLVMLYALRGQRRTRHALIAAAALATVIGPVALRNTILAREPLLTTTQAGQNLYIGNGPHNRTGQYEAPPWLRASPLYEETDLRTWAETQSGRGLGYGELSRFYLSRTIEQLTRQPAASLRLLARKAVLFLNRTEIPDNYDLSFMARHSPVLRLPLPGFAVVFSLGLAGLLLFFRRSAAHRALALFLLLYAASVITFFVLARYRLPAVAALLPFAGGTTARLLDLLLARRYRRLAALLVLVLAGLAVTLAPVRTADRRNEHAQSLVNLAATYYHEGDTAAATRTYREALELMPGHPRAAHGLGMMMLARGDYRGALGQFEVSTAGRPTDPAMYYHHGQLLERFDRSEEALRSYRRSVELNPAEPRYRFAVGSALQRLGRFGEALALYDTMLTQTPDAAPLHHNRAVALFNLGRLQEAEAELEAVRRLGGEVNPDFERRLRIEPR
ncbi:MAG: glycosyltransferase family 39 protein [bacterium]